MEKLELKIPPVAVFLIVVLMMSYMAKNMQFAGVHSPFSGLVLLACLALSSFIALSGVREFRHAETTVNPVKPDTATTVVDSGVFSRTRNPMYLGLFICLFGIGYWLQNGLSLLMSFSFIWYMNRFQISVEERALEKRFGVAYVEYKQRVRRWI
ncbi:isoprenylcysteine carboxylmethyltransferase family protein [Vibrio amylolyticus]|uniref:methyltransferase family protein n=1 Tax=Vibrio amylolyticus TaxID=2847292 RepID=UPI00354E4C62